jgi:glycosyltransferase involved in cell wall biosynthesis
MVDLVRERYGLRPERIVCIPHWSVMDQESPLAFEQCALAQSLGLLGKFVVQYSGNMGLWHDIEIFVRAAAVLQHVPEIQFLFIGSGMRRAGAEALSKQFKLRNITWKSFVPKEQLRDSLACCHMSLVSMREGLTGIAVPCKIYGILASGRAMLAMAPAQTEVARVVEEEQCGVVVEPGNLEQLVATIQRLYADRVLTAGMGRNAFRAYKTKYTLEQATSTFEQVWSLAEPSASATPPPMRIAV